MSLDSRSRCWRKARHSGLDPPCTARGTDKPAAGGHPSPPQLQSTQALLTVTSETRLSISLRGTAASEQTAFLYVCSDRTGNSEVPGSQLAVQRPGRTRAAGLAVNGLGPGSRRRWLPSGSLTERELSVPRTRGDSTQVTPKTHTTRMGHSQTCVMR